MVWVPHQSCRQWKQYRKYNFCKVGHHEVVTKADLLRNSLSLHHLQGKLELHLCSWYLNLDRRCPIQNGRQFLLQRDQSELGCEEQRQWILVKAQPAEPGVGTSRDSWRHWPLLKSGSSLWSSSPPSSCSLAQLFWLYEVQTLLSCSLCPKLYQDTLFLVSNIFGADQQVWET